MKKLLLPLALVLSISAVVLAQNATTSPAAPASPAATPTAAAPARGPAAARGPGTGAAQASANTTKRLASQVRHQDWVKIKQGNREIDCLIIYPEAKDKAPAVVMVMEIFGLSDWLRAAADQMAESGYIAVVPDLLSGMGPNGGGTSAIAAGDVTRAVQSLPAAQVTADLDAVSAYASKIPSCNGQIVMAGFCWGGGKVFSYATVNPTVKATFVFYGATPSLPNTQPPQIDAAALAKITGPIYGFYGENDTRLSGNVPATIEAMKAAGKTYESVIYPGAAHGFVRTGQMDNATAADKSAAEAAWKRMGEVLAKLKTSAAAPATTTPAAAAATPATTTPAAK